ncbi:DNA-directed RNA polymerase subunit beta' [Erythrobacter sp. MTPC3]|uniref:DNA-directed RNA polymerase subunit beta' n=1 Tax=Erythrobacter sp. MTPC3 TaxID=3056564 RepID=UPI0036F20432
MKHHSAPSATRQALIERLAEPPRIESLSAIGARFVYSQRLIALHKRARRDPVPELAVRMGSVETAAKALALTQAIASCWPENIHVARFCCEMLTHDELTIGAMVDSAARADRAGFESAISGLVRPDRAHRLWEPVLALVAAEAKGGILS